MTVKDLFEQMGAVLTKHPELADKRVLVVTDDGEGDQAVVAKVHVGECDECGEPSVKIEVE